MSLSIPLAYGTDVHFFNCRASTDILTAGEPAVTIDEGQFQARLQDYLSNADFDLERTTIMVADKTRLCGYSRYLPVLLTALDNHGARMDRLTLSVAYGTHIRQTEAHSREAYGP
ncbi:MAG: DUF2088 domain-containing protein, partial [Desulfatitalea sp.]|nr:DUF2088 domain-containing protein [Desulfatitalea sp.]